MNKKLLVVLSLLSAMTASAFGIGCAGDNKEESTPATSISSPAESEQESSEDKTSSEDVTSSEENSSANTEPSLTLYQSSVSVEAYTTAALTAKLENSEAELVWSSSDESIATVENGIVFAVKAGTATITATAGTVSATFSVTVTSE